MFKRAAWSAGEVPAPLPAGNGVLVLRKVQLPEEFAEPLVGDPSSGMVQIPRSAFLMGSDKHYPEEAPAHHVEVDGFWIDTRAVTNHDFERFVAATGYITVAERPLDPTLYPNADPKLAVP